MTPLWITSATYAINDRPAALQFDSAMMDFFKLVKIFEKQATPIGFLKIAYVMFVFDPDPKYKRPEDIPKFNKREMSAEINIAVDRAVFSQIESQNQINWFYEKLIIGLQSIRASLKPTVKHELDELIKALCESAGINEPPVKLASADDPLELQDDAVYQLVFQFSENDFPHPDEMFALEEKLAKALSKIGDVDGNDIGQGKFNIFVLTKLPAQAFELSREMLKKEGLLNKVKVAYTESGQDDFSMLWPKRKNYRFEL